MPVLDEVRQIFASANRPSRFGTVGNRMQGTYPTFIRLNPPQSDAHSPLGKDVLATLGVTSQLSSVALQPHQVDSDHPGSVRVVQPPHSPQQVVVGHHLPGLDRKLDK